MEEEKDTVTNSEEAVASEQEVQQEEQVTQQTSEAADAGTPAPSQTTQTSQDQYEALDPSGVPWKNRAMEAGKRLEQMPEVIRQTVEEVMQKQQTQAQTPKYTRENIPQLKAWAEDHPEHRAWVEQQIENIRADETAKVVKESLSSFKQEQTNAQTRQQSEQWVLSHPEFKECFTSDAFGNKVWNMTNPLTQMASQILNTVDPISGKLVKDRPDGLAVAFEMAYGRYALSMKGKSMSQMNQVKKDLRKAQKMTVTQGGGTQVSANSGNAVRRALDNYKTTKSKNDIQDATKAYLRQTGILKEE